MTCKYPIKEKKHAVDLKPEEEEEGFVPLGAIKGRNTKESTFTLGIGVGEN